MFVKICGLRDPEAVDAAVAAGADALGFNLVPGVRRQITPELARSLGERAQGRLRVGIFRGQGARDVVALAQAAAVDAVQVYEEETARLLRGRYSVLLAWNGQGRPPVDAADRVLCDPGGGGAGTPWDWSRVRGLPVVLSGGLRPDNVAAALEAARPLGVDVSSGVETDGVKDPAKIRAFCAQVRGWAADGAAAG
jgi:phosphoribosylanthranilate isomerase